MVTFTPRSSNITPASFTPIGLDILRNWTLRWQPRRFVPITYNTIKHANTSVLCWFVKLCVHSSRSIEGTKKQARKSLNRQLGAWCRLGFFCFCCVTLQDQDWGRRNVRVMVRDWVRVRVRRVLGYRRKHSWSSIFMPSRNHNLCLTVRGTCYKRLGLG